MKLVEDDASMNAIIVKVMELQNQESTEDVYKRQVYHVGQTYRNYQRISYEIGNERFPQELLKYRSVEDSLALMRRKCCLLYTSRCV